MVNAITLQSALNLPFAEPNVRLNRRYHTLVKLHMTPEDLLRCAIKDAASDLQGIPAPILTLSWSTTGHVCSSIRIIKNTPPLR